MKETIGDIDVVAASTDPASLADDFAEAPFAEEVLAHGPKKVFVLSGGTEINLRIVEPQAHRTLLHHFTGGQGHNIALREPAAQQGVKNSEYGPARGGTGGY